MIRLLAGSLFVVPFALGLFLPFRKALIVGAFYDIVINFMLHSGQGINAPVIVNFIMPVLTGFFEALLLVGVGYGIQLIVRRVRRSADQS